MFDVVALGELLIDFTPLGVSKAGNPVYEQNPGGAPANVLVTVRRLGGSSAFIGKVGQDNFGHFLKKVLENNQIDTTGLRYSEEAFTTLAFVHLDAKGDRSFSFCRNPGADTLLRVKDVDFSLIDAAKIFHFGSISLSTEPSRSATIAAVEYAKRAGCFVSYDPNWRPPLWKNDATAKEEILRGLKYADILKISESELTLITGESSLEKGSEMLYKDGIKLIVVTMGPNGCYYKYHGGSGKVATYDTHVVDTTGAGDAFLGGLLYRISKLNDGIEQVEKSQLEEMLDFSNAAGALCASKRGAISAMPDLVSVQDCIEHSAKVVRDL
jgi:fructokinase